MSSEWLKFLADNASAVFGLLGALGGGILSFIASLLLKRREFNLQIRGRLLDRQIAAHENILKLAVEMRVMVGSGGLDELGEVRRGPRIMLSKNEFDAWFGKFGDLQLQGTTWLNISTKREVNFVQDYLVTLHMHLAEVPSNRVFELGELIRQDFIDLSAALEKKAFSFFEKGVRKSKLESLSAWHKYKRQVTLKRLTETALLRKIEHFKSSVAEPPQAS